MSLSIVTFADLGERKNLKTADIFPILDIFSQKGLLNQVICRRAKNSSYPNTYQSISTLFFYFSKFISKISRGLIPIREWEWYLVDGCAKQNLGYSDVILCHPALFKRTIEKANRIGAVSVGLATVAHPSHTETLMKEEYKVLGMGYVDNRKESKQNNKKVITNFDYIIALSDFVKSTYVENGFPGNNIFVAEPDIDFSRFSFETKPENKEFSVLFPASSVSILKGLQYLLRAWQKADLPNGKLVLLGKRSGWPQELEREVSQIVKSNTNIEEKGIVSNPEDYFQQADVVVYPSLTEGFGRASLEAMACGTPVIVTENAKGIVEDRETGFVLPIRDVQGIKENLEYLYNNRDKAREMGEKAAQAARNKKPFGEAVYEIYQEICKREGI